MKIKNPQSGFTLLELMVVLLLIGVMAGMAVSSMRSRLPMYRLTNSTRTMQQIFNRARNHAYTQRRLVKLCIFSDDNYADDTARGLIRYYQCGDVGNGACDRTGICTATSTAAAPGLDASEIDCADSTKWCLAEEYDYGSLVNGLDHVSIAGFRNSDGTANADKTIEITFTASSLISLYNGTTLPSGAIVLTSYDFCSPGYSGSTFTCTGGPKRAMQIDFAAGGGTQVRDKATPY